MIKNEFNEKLTNIYNRKIKALEILLSLSCILCIFSQLPIDNLSDILRDLGFVFWILTLFYIILSFGRQLNIKKIYYSLPVLIFDGLIILFQVFSGKNYLSSQLFYPIHLSFFILLTSYFSGQFLTEKSFKFIINFYITGVLIVSLYIFFNYYIGTSWFNSRLYIYEQKNSFAQNVLFSAVLIYMYGFLNKNKLKFPLIFLMVFFLFLLKCRSTLVGLFITVFYIVFFNIKKLSVKVFAIIILSVFLLSIFIIPSFNEFFIDNMLFNNRINQSWAGISSGRDYHFQRFIDLFHESPLIGNGKIRIESFPLSVLAAFGLLAGSFILYFSIMPLITCIKKLSKKEYSTLLTILFIFTFISLSNCLFEEQAPFGPGVKCFFLWFIYGNYLGREDSLINEYLS